VTSVETREERERIESCTSSDGMTMEQLERNFSSAHEKSSPCCTRTTTNYIERCRRQSSTSWSMPSNLFGNNAVLSIWFSLSCSCWCYLGGASRLNSSHQRIARNRRDVHYIRHCVLYLEGYWKKEGVAGDGKGLQHDQRDESAVDCGSLFLDCWSLALSYDTGRRSATAFRRRFDASRR